MGRFSGDLSLLLLWQRGSALLFSELGLIPSHLRISLTGVQSSLGGGVHFDFAGLKSDVSTKLATVSRCTFSSNHANKAPLPFYGSFAEIAYPYHASVVCAARRWLVHLDHIGNNL